MTYLTCRVAYGSPAMQYLNGFTSFNLECKCSHMQTQLVYIVASRASPLLKVVGPGGDGAKAGEGLFHNISRRISEY